MRAAFELQKGKLEDSQLWAVLGLNTPLYILTTIVLPRVQSERCILNTEAQYCATIHISAGVITNTDFYILFGELI